MSSPVHFNIDPVALHTERDKAIPLCGEVLAVGRATGGPDQHRGHDQDCTGWALP